VRRRDALMANDRARARDRARRLGGALAWRARFDIAAEQACDEEAARAVDDRVAVASAILAVEAGRAGTPPPISSRRSRSPSDSARREARRGTPGDPVPPRSLLAITAVAVAVAIVLLAQSGELHHLIESRSPTSLTEAP